VAAVREAVGPDVDLCIEVHGRLAPAWSIEMARRLKPFDPFFYEEPVPPEHMDELALVARATSIPIASGERAFFKHGFRPMLEAQAVAYIQPDPCHAGGITEMKKIAAMAESFYVSVIPHNPCGPVATAVNAQFAACTQNFVILEYKADDEPPRRDLLQEPVRLVDGYLELPTAPGLGISLNEEFIARNQSEGWRRTLPTRPDGSLGYV